MSFLKLNKRYGTHRTTYLVGKYAIKIPATSEWRMFLHGLLANLQETTFSWRKWPELCPVVFSLPLGFLIVMLRAEPLSMAEFEQFSERYESFAIKYNYTIPVENKLDSFGKLNGKIVAVDYG